MTEQANSKVSRPGQRSSHIRTAQAGATAVALAVMAGLTLAGAVWAQVKDEPAAGSSPETACGRAGAVWWNELLAPETEKLGEFYAKVIGWNTKVVDVEDQSQPPRTPNDRYVVFMDGGDQEVAGLMSANHPEAIHSRAGWFTYIQVANVDLAAAIAQATGGTVVRQPADTSDGNRVAVISDPAGNAFGIVTPAKKGPC
jgi:predicted enzyme related to lactoylglutathione lyase